MAAGRPVIGATSDWAVETLLDRLRGEWTFARGIDNGVTVNGRVRFTPAGDGRLLYREEGRMQLPGGAELDAFVDYIFAREGERLLVLFAEEPPRLYQSFALRLESCALTADSLHDCPPDLYRSRIAFDADGTWALRHAVHGPRKGYVSVTRYRRSAV